VILLPKPMKPLTMTEVYLLTEPFIRAQWPHQYGLTTSGELVAGSIPAYNGCLILWFINLEWEAFFDEAQGKLDAYILEELKELIAKRNYMAARALIHRLDRAKLREILLTRSGLVRSIEFELPLTIPIPTKVEEGDASLELACLREVLINLRELVLKVTSSASSIFMDAEVRKWSVPMVHPLDIYEIYEESAGSLEELLRHAVNELLAIITEEMSKPAYVVILRGEVPGDVSLSDFEAQLSHEVSSLTRLLEPASIFTTLVS